MRHTCNCTPWPHLNNGLQQTRQLQRDLLTQPVKHKHARVAVQVDLQVHVLQQPLFCLGTHHVQQPHRQVQQHGAAAQSTAL